jgi:elongation factor Ts
VGDLLSASVGKLGENLQIRRFSRFRLGEGIEKPADDFAEEVRQQVAG